MTLIPISKDTLDWIRFCRNHPGVMDYSGQHEYISESKQLDWFEHQSKDATSINYAYGEQPNNSPTAKCFGIVGLKNIDLVHRRAEFSIFIDPNNQKKGHGKKALLELLDYGFNSVGLNTIYGLTMEGNPASKLFEKLSLEQTGIMRDYFYKKGVFVNGLIYSVRKKKWKQPNSIHGYC